MANYNGFWRNGNFLYPYARALMLASGGGPANEGVYWGHTATPSPFRIMFLNGGVGTAYNFTGRGGALTAPNNLFGHAAWGVSGYAWNPALDTANDVIVGQMSASPQLEGGTRAQITSGTRFAGSLATSLGSIPPSHRTFQRFWDSTNSNIFGGTANTAVVAGTSITYNGVADADDVTVYQVPAGAVVSAFVLYKLPSAVANNDFTGFSGAASTDDIDRVSLLIAYFDSATGLPVNGNGGDITVVWDNGANKIFKI